MTNYQIKFTHGGIIVFNADNLVGVVKEVNKILRTNTHYEDEIVSIEELTDD
tara:strand:+ start:530 stop:685 length:156 start_codon:yes stop_codon:yes gene_type:complete